MFFVLQEADIALAPISITPNRQHAVDFSYGYMAAQATILMMKPKRGYGGAVTTVQDLVNKTGMVYGTVKDSSLAQHLEGSRDPMYRNMWKVMKGTQPSPFVRSVDAGIARIRQSYGKYALLMESTTAEYITSKEPCDLIAVDKFLFERAYAFAFPKNSQWKEIFDSGLLTLQSNQDMHELYYKWWRGECFENEQGLPVQSASSGSSGLLSSLFTVICIVLFRRVL